MKNKQLASELIDRVTELEIKRDPKTHGLSAIFMGFPYSKIKGFDKSKTILLASEFTFTSNFEFCYFAQNKQVNGSHYIQVIRVSDLSIDLITYCDSKQDAKDTIKRIENHPQFNYPEVIKRAFYCGSGSSDLHLHNYLI